MKKFFGILTEIGEAKQAKAMALGKTLRITEIEVGDGGGENAPLPTPDPKQKKLINSRHRAPINQLRVDPNNANYMIAEQIIFENEGGWWVREMGARDEDGDLVAVSNCAPSYKPLLAEGSGRHQIVRMVFMVASAGAFELKIDPTVVLATRQYVDDSFSLLLGKQDTAEAAKKLQTARKISLTGAVSGSAKFDGSGDIEIKTVDGGELIWVPYRATVPVKKEGDIIMVRNRGELHWVETPYFTGYRSPLCGAVEYGHTVGPLPWQVDGTGIVLNKADYPALWGYALDNGLVVSSAIWTAYTLRYADLDATRFRVPDLRNMFIRGTGTDADTSNVRSIGSSQAQRIQSTLVRVYTGGGSGPVNGMVGSKLGQSGFFSSTYSDTVYDYGYLSGMGWIGAGSETRPANIALHPRLHV